MKHLSLLRLTFLSLTLLSLFSCKKKTEDFDEEPFQQERLKELIPLQAGKYITYRVDSLKFMNFGRNPETHSYQVKHVIDAEITDNLGRPSWRVYRFIRNAAGTTEWEASGSYFITLLDDRVELIEDNLRVLKLHLPVREGYTWKGNKHIPDDAYELYGYAFSNDDNMKSWDFTYDIIEPVFTYDNIDYNDVYTVEQEDFSDNVPITLPQVYAIKTRSVEKYSKDIGLVYREYDLWEYQPNPNGNPFYIGFGLKMWMIDHN